MPSRRVRYRRVDAVRDHPETAWLALSPGGVQSITAVKCLETATTGAEIDVSGKVESQLRDLIERVGCTVKLTTRESGHHVDPRGHPGLVHRRDCRAQRDGSETPPEC